MEHKARAFLETLGLTLIYLLALIPVAALIIGCSLVRLVSNRSACARRAIGKHLDR
jgi:hypothetical protein